ncbi:MAG: hypothetical protein MUF18_10685 [Fimbriiglobus sp.]|jgi:hypothetical protein|nr:hypothetical protein [Fimbriiglobus sp.]
MSWRKLTTLALAAAALGCGQSTPPPATEAKPTPAATTPTVAATQADPNAPTADSTFTYWERVYRLQEAAARRHDAATEPKPDVVKELLTATANKIDELPTEKTDPQAIGVGRELAKTLRSAANGGEAVAEAVGLQARTARTALSTKYGREFPALDAAKAATFRLLDDIRSGPTLAQGLAKLKSDLTTLDAEIKPVNQQLTAETADHDRLSGEAAAVREILKNQTSDADLKKVREEVLTDAVKQVEAKKKTMAELTKTLTSLRTRRGELERLAFEVGAALKDGAPEKPDTLSVNQWERLRVQADKLREKLAARAK